MKTKTKVKAGPTPGPWKATRLSISSWWGIESESVPSGTISGRGFEIVGHEIASEQNARLIAAAPELLEAARLAVINGIHAAACEFTISTETKPCDCYVLKLRAAIAKAEGK